MSITYEYEASSNIVRATATKVLTAKELHNYVSSIVEDNRIKSGFVEVVDFQGVKDLVVTYSDTEPFRAVWGKYIQK